MRITGPWTGLRKYLELEKRSQASERASIEAWRLLDRYGPYWARTLGEYLEDSRERAGCWCREIAEKLEAEEEKHDGR